MGSPQLDDQVILQRDIPELSLRRGDIGVVRGTINEPTAAFDVEFDIGLSKGTRARLMATEIRVRVRDDQFDSTLDGGSLSSALMRYVCALCGQETAEREGAVCPACTSFVAKAGAPEGSLDSDGAKPDSRRTPVSPHLLRELDRPTQIGPYRILETIGEGSMGVVYKAEQRSPVRRVVAVKVVKLGMDTKEVIARFEVERQALALMNHPHVAKVLDAGVSEHGTPYFVMEHVPGEPITGYCDSHKLPIGQRLELFIQACEAVQHAHQKAIIHRDIKPGNVLVTEAEGSPSVKVIDFGIAKAVNHRLTDRTLFTEQGRLIGTPEYMSPEQADLSAIDIDTRADVYSLGVLLYELLAGSLPFDSKTLRTGGYEALRKVIREQQPTRPSERVLTGDDAQRIAEARATDCDSLAHLLRKELEWVPLKAMRKDRTERYRSASQLADEVRNYLAGRPLLAGPPTTAYRVRKFVAKHAQAVGSAAASLAIILGLLVALAFATRRAIVAQHKEAVHRQRAEEQAGIARSEALRAGAAEIESQRQLARGLEFAGDSLAKSNQLADARLCYSQAFDILRKLGMPETAALAGMIAAGGDEMPLMGPYGGGAGARGFAGPTSSVTAVALSRDGHTALTSSEDGTLRMWDVRTGLEIHTPGKFEGHSDSASFVALSPDERTALSSGYDGTVKVWNLVTGKCVADLTSIDPNAAEPPQQLWVGGFSGDGSLVVAGGLDSKVRVWNAMTGKLLREMSGHEGQIGGAVFLRDGRYVLTASHDRTLKLWDLTTGKAIRTFTGHAQPVNCVALSPDESTAVSASFDQTLRLWNVQTGEEIAPPFEGHADWVWRVAFSADGRRIISGSRDGTARVWDVKTRKLLRTFSSQTQNVMGVAFSGDGRLAVSTRGPAAGTAWPHDEGVLALWNVEPGNQSFGDPQTGAPVTAVAVSAERTVLSGSGDGTLTLWDASTHRTLRTFPAHVGAVLRICLSADGRTARTIGEDGAARRWELATGRQSGPQIESGLTAASAVVPGDRFLLSGGEDGVLKLWDIQSPAQPRQLPGEAAATTCVAASQDGSRALSGDVKGVIRLWDLRAGVLVRQFNAHSGRVNCVAFSPRSNLALSGGEDRQITLWDLDTGKPVRNFPAQADAVTCTAFAGDGITALSGSADGTVTLWDVQTGAPVRKFAGHADAITGVSFTPDGRCAVTGSRDHTVRLWDLTRSARYREFEIRLPSARAALEQNPQDPAALLAFGEWYAFRGKDDWAVDFLRQARAGGAKVSPLMLARSYFRLNEPGEARIEFQNAVTKEETSSFYAALCLQAMAAPPATMPAQ